MPVIWGLANPKVGEHDTARHLRDHDHHLVHPGQVIVADRGFAGREFEEFITEELGAELIRPDEAPRFGALGGVRQWVESVCDPLTGQLGLKQHGGRTVGDVYVRVGAELLAAAAAIWHNWLINAPDKRSLIAYDHCNQ